MSVLLSLAIIVAIVAIVAVAIRRNNNVKAAAVVATTEVVTANAAVATTEVVAAAVVAPSAAHTQDVCDPINVMPALVMVLAYTKSALKEERLNGRRARARAAHKAACARSHAAYIAGAAKRQQITLACKNRAAVRAAQKAQEAQAKAQAKAQEAQAKAQGISVAKLLARKAQGDAQRAANAARKQAAAHVGKKATANRHVASRGIVSITADGHKVVTPANKQAVKPVRTYVRTIKRVPTTKAANAAPRGKDLAAAAQSVHGNLIARIHAAKATLESLYAILPLARQVVGLSNKASRKVGLYNWLSDEGHVGVRSTKASIDRRDAAQEVVCQAILAEEAFKKAYGIEAHEVYNTIRAVKAAKARAVEMLRDHKAEQHRLFIERQERRAAKAALKASKAAPVAAPAVTEVADWEQYASANNGNKAIAFALLGAKGSTMAEKISASLAIAGVHHESDLVTCETVDAAYVVAA